MRKIRINETRLRQIVTESINRALNEAVDAVERVTSLIDTANKAYEDAAAYTEDTMPLVDKDGDSYGLVQPITLKRGHVIIRYNDPYRKYMDMDIRVLAKQNGKTVLVNGDFWDEGWKDAKKELNQIIKDAERGRKHFQGYDPNWEEADTPEDFKANRERMEKFNKSIGVKPKRGVDLIKSSQVKDAHTVRSIGHIKVWPGPG